MKGATGVHVATHTDGLNFNPRSREGSDADPPLSHLSDNISIHAPVKGATVHAYKESLAYQISIHAPVKGATKGPADKPLIRKFQSTLP